MFFFFFLICPDKLRKQYLYFICKNVLITEQRTLCVFMSLLLTLCLWPRSSAFAAFNGRLHNWSQVVITRCGTIRTSANKCGGKKTHPPLWTCVRVLDSHKDAPFFFSFTNELYIFLFYFLWFVAACTEELGWNHHYTYKGGTTTSRSYKQFPDKNNLLFTVSGTIFTSSLFNDTVAQHEIHTRVYPLR